MRIVQYHRRGGAEVLQLDDVPVPSPGVGELLVEVAAAGVSLAEVRRTRTTNGPWPMAPGGEIAGKVAALGAGVEGWQIGQSVVSVAFGGSYAEFALAQVAFTLPVPEAVSESTAVALFRNGQVALGALRSGEVTLEDDVIVTAAAGGVGHLAVQLATVLGARRVIGAVGSSGKEGFVRRLGVDNVLSYADAAPTWGEQVSLVLDGAGGPALHRGIAALAPFGRLVTYSAAGGSIDVNDLRSQSRRVVGFTLAHLAQASPERYRQHGEQLWRLAAEGHLRAALYAELPLSGAVRAHRMLESRENCGKVILRPRGEGV